MYTNRGKYHFDRRWKVDHPNNRPLINHISTTSSVCRQTKLLLDIPFGQFDMVSGHSSYLCVTSTPFDRSSDVNQVWHFKCYKKEKEKLFAHQLNLYVKWHEHPIHIWCKIVTSIETCKLTHNVKKSARHSIWKSIRFWFGNKAEWIRTLRAKNKIDERVERLITHQWQRTDIGCYHTFATNSHIAYA